MTVAMAALAFFLPHKAVVQSTAYCSSGTMANGRFTHVGAVAMNMLPLGKRVSVNRSPTGLRFHRVEDRIGWGSQLDFYVPSCSRARAWGRRYVTVRWR